ncbi:bifunctional metallophosphatase/5'-nucleotidase [Carnobacteriaceae bacterium zg-84]|uniref:bifunctional metallophosphatase/5'-nucleotidase n=1 Tax=Granulicatella sp. zg-84 TaxID=2678503 RepID=UPI0013BED6C9|nr:bifunctional UDP-sugar hydrolase/5'-nucleotidase [Granulicatella sp. zg-84]NEW66601.1 bifunctional metallophosphatase/5'-nucleotidase [Granulicatella sp. zg-84]QMI86252.1 bifunctional metallophosphatase/5'-nucleotidase [Carnobacteriaceae bacterium zg-84]
MFKILATTDVHGNLLAYDFVTSKQAIKGLSKFSTYLKQQRALHHVIYIDNGDINQGTPLVTYANSYVPENISAKALNLLSCDFVNIGNHDFNYGSDFLYRYIQENHAKCVTSNVLYKNQPIGQTHVITCDEKKIGLVGVVTDYIEHWENPNNLTHLDILSVIDTVKKEVAHIRQEVDYVVVVYHGGFERDIETGEPTERLTGENVGYALCTEIDGIDVLITGHQHRQLVGKINGTHIIQAPDGCFKCMEITFSDTISVNLIDVSEYEVDTEFENYFKNELDKTENWLDTEIGTTNLKDCYIKDIKQAQLTKHPITAFINRVQMTYMQADISACCLFDVMPGFGDTLKYRDIILNYPFPNTLVLKEMTGQHIMDYLTQLSQYWVVKEDAIDINPKFLYPKREVYNYDLLDGITYTMNISKTKDNFISDVYVKGEPLVLEKTYKLVLNNYRATGGGNFAMFPELKTIKEDTHDIAEILIDYVKEKRHIVITDEQNIRLTVVD